MKTFILLFFLQLNETTIKKKHPGFKTPKLEAFEFKKQSDTQVVFEKEKQWHCFRSQISVHLYMRLKFVLNDSVIYFSVFNNETR